MRTYWIIPVLFLSACGSADGPERVAMSGDWQVMTADRRTDQPLCYAGTEPLGSQGTIRSRDAKSYLIATRRPNGKLEMSASSGYRYMGSSKVELVIDDETFTLFHKDSTAWARTDREDASIISALKSAESVELRGVSWQGLTSIDRYSAKGFAEALEQVRKNCP